MEKMKHNVTWPQAPCLEEAAGTSHMHTSPSLNYGQRKKLCHSRMLAQGSPVLNQFLHYTGSEGEGKKETKSELSFFIDLQ